MEMLEKLTQRELVNAECSIMKMCFEFLFKTKTRLELPNHKLLF